MAKKETKKVEREFSFEDMDKALSKVPGFELGSILEDNLFSKVDEWIPTPNYLLNAQISGSLFGGLPNSRAIGFVGDPETGKTFLCLNICREAQKMGYNIIYCETEGAIDKESVERIGVDVKKVRYQPIHTVNEFKRFTVQVIDMVKKMRAAGQNPKIMMVLDSLGMLSTEKEINDAMIGKDAMDMGIKAKQLRSMFKIITLDLAANKIPLMVTNHTTIGNIGSYTGPTKESAGGDGPIFSLSTVLLMSKKFDVEDGTKAKVGIIITTRPKKSRSTIPHNINIHVGFASGMNKYVGLEEYVNWDACGIERGKIMTEKEYKKLGSTTGKPFEFTDADGKTETLVFVPSESGRWCVKHLGKSLQNGSMLFNKGIFTDEVLKNLDEKVIQPTFRLPEYSDPDKIVITGAEDDEESDQDVE